MDDTPHEGGDERGDEGASGLPPHPLDRVWFHPSELSAFTAPAPPTRTSTSRTPIAVAGVFGVLLTVVVLAATGVFREERTVKEQTRLTALSVAGNDRVAQLVSGAAPSVVSVRVSGPAGDARGSGVALGRLQVITSAGLVAPGGAVMLSTNDGRVLTATVVGYDLETDLALLEVDGGTDDHDALTPARLGTADALKVGQTVVAVGMAGGNHRWASRGVVSALGRVAASPSGAALAGLVETDIDPGDAVGGGALLDAGGTVVGILTRAAPGRALPIDVARDIADQLATNGRAQHGWMGVATVDANDRPGGGALVIAVMPGGPAETAGLAVGDVVVGLGSDRVTDTADLMSATTRRRPGDPVGITVWRSSKRLHRDVDLADGLLAPAMTS
jgi:putative serine protease PepD